MSYLGLPIWCELCRNHYPTEHFSEEDGRHYAGEAFGPEGMAVEFTDAEVDALGAFLKVEWSPERDPGLASAVEKLSANRRARSRDRSQTSAPDTLGREDTA